MIKIFRQSRRTIYMEFDEEGNDSLIKMFRQIQTGKEFVLNVEFDMAVVKMRKTQSQTYVVNVENDNAVDGSIIYFQDGRIMWKIDNEYVDMGLQRFQECKEQETFFPAEFMDIQVPKNKDLDDMYCYLISDKKVTLSGVKMKKQNNGQ